MVVKTDLIETGTFEYRPEGSESKLGSHGGEGEGKYSKKSAQCCRSTARRAGWMKRSGRGRGEEVGDEIEVLESHILKSLLDHINEFQLRNQFLCAISEEKY